MANNDIINGVMRKKGMMSFMLCFMFLNSYCLSIFSEAQSVPGVFVFGDSLVDVGNNNFLKLSLVKANYHPNGVDFPGKKATGRFSNGKNAADFLAEKVGLPTSPPYLSLVKSSNAGSSFITGVSFASAGAGIFNGTDEIYRQSIPLTQQVEHYTRVHEKLVEQLGAIGSANHLSKSLFPIVIGSNDLFGYFGSSKRSSKVTPQDFVNQMVAHLTQQIKNLYNLGARKIVMVGVGAIGCCPDERKKSSSGECFEEANHWSVEFNNGIKTSLQQLKSELVGFNFVLVDTYQILQNLIQKPASYGFTEVKAACCGVGKLNADLPCLPLTPYCSHRANHVFWDRYHPSEASSRVLVDTIFGDSNNAYSFPMNINQLIAI